MPSWSDCAAKLDRFYDLNILANPQLREQAAHHVGVLYDAIKRHRLVKIEGYSSPHSKSCTDRVVEPFLMMNNNNDVRCYELSSKMNKTFRGLTYGQCYPARFWSGATRPSIARCLPISLCLVVMSGCLSG